MWVYASAISNVVNLFSFLVMDLEELSITSFEGKNDMNIENLTIWVCVSAISNVIDLSYFLEMDLEGLSITSFKGKNDTNICYKIYCNIKFYELMYYN